LDKLAHLNLLAVGDGHEFLANRERYLLQSQMTRRGKVPEPPELTDIPALAAGRGG
jgi:hypothetical protein